MHLPSYHFFLVGKITLNASAPQNVMPDARLLKYNLYTSPSKLKSPSTSHTNNTPITFRSVSRLGQALYTVLTDSKINIINIPVVNRSLFEQLQNITLSFNDPHKLIGKNITLHKFYRYSLTQKNLQSSENILINASPAFPKGLRPFMLFTTIANSISNNTMTTKSNTTFTIKNTIALPSTWINIYKSAPYFVLGFVKFSNEAI